MESKRLLSVRAVVRFSVPEDNRKLTTPVLLKNVSFLGNFNDNAPCYITFCDSTLWKTFKRVIKIADIENHRHFYVLCAIFSQRNNVFFLNFECHRHAAINLFELKFDENLKSGCLSCSQKYACATAMTYIVPKATAW